MVTVLVNSETQVNQNDTPRMMKLHFTCFYNKLSKSSPNVLKHFSRWLLHLEFSLDKLIPLGKWDMDTLFWIFFICQH